MKRVFILNSFLFIALCVTAQTFYVYQDCSKNHSAVPEGALPGIFSVSSTKKVRFSKGNLQYTTSGTHQCSDNTTQPGTWRFAEEQFDYIGEGNMNVSSSYVGWIDVFSWGTSGWKSGAKEYQPYSKSSSYSDYLSGSLTGKNANADWGVYNQIENGGNVSWRVLTANEWDYLLTTRINAQKLYGQATVCGKAGMIFLPDNWQLPEGLEYFVSGTGDFSQNIFNYSQWKVMESAGAIFLPAAGFRRNKDTFYVEGMFYIGKYGFYWSSSSTGEYYAYFLAFYSGYTSAKATRTGNNSVDIYGRARAHSVRLVCDSVGD